MIFTAGFGLLPTSTGTVEVHDGRGHWGTHPDLSTAEASLAGTWAFNLAHPAEPTSLPLCPA